MLLNINSHVYKLHTCLAILSLVLQGREIESLAKIWLRLQLGMYSKIKEMWPGSKQTPYTSSRFLCFSFLKFWLVILNKFEPKHVELTLKSTFWLSSEANQFLRVFDLPKLLVLPKIIV